MVFLDLKKLLDLYQLYELNWADIKSSIEFHKNFFESIAKLFRPVDKFKFIGEAEMHAMRQDILRIKDTVRYNKPILDE